MFNQLATHKSSKQDPQAVFRMRNSVVTSTFAAHYDVLQMREFHALLAAYLQS